MSRELIVINLEKLKPNLNNIISTIASITNIEYAIFNTDAELVSSSQTYEQKKGQTVHTASINEVLSMGNVIVNKPGLMNSCIGCRFVNNCPSTIEILTCIKLNGEAIGVVSITSFSREGHTMIENNINKYTGILVHISNLVTMFVLNETALINNIALHKAMDEIVKEVNQGFITIDTNGSIIYWDKSIQNLFSYCDLHIQSIYQIFPKYITNWIVSSNKSTHKYVSINEFKGLIYLTPLIEAGNLIGYSLKLEEKNININQDLEINYLSKIITKSKELNDIKKIILKISDSSSSVLVTGDTGTGKEMIAKAIHYTSTRKDKDFVAINCANIPESLFESELFGYEEGAFTSAKRGGKVGLFELANGGTIFLDEIGELPLYLQAKLLRVLQENTIQRLGSITSIPINVRIIAATNKILDNMIIDGTFREDLFYRINVIPMHLPALRERLNDIEILSQHFIEKYNNILNKNISQISQESLEALKLYTWPGNVRELENTIEYAINMEDSNTLQLSNLPNRITASLKDNTELKNIIAIKEYNLIVNALDKNGWDVKGKEKAAKELGLSLRTLYRKLNEHK